MEGQPPIRQRDRATRHRPPDRGDGLGAADLLAQSHSRALSRSFFAAETYTTLGEGAVRLPQSWRQLGPIIAVSGLFTFGWTSSVLVYIMTQFGTSIAITPRERKPLNPAPRNFGYEPGMFPNALLRHKCMVSSRRGSGPSSNGKIVAA